MSFTDVVVQYQSLCLYLAVVTPYRL